MLAFTCMRFSRQKKLHPETEKLLGEISIKAGSNGLYSAAKRLLDVIKNENDLALAGALVVMRIVILHIARELDDDPEPEKHEYYSDMIDAIIRLTTHRDPQAFARFHQFR